MNINSYTCVANDLYFLNCHYSHLKGYSPEIIHSHAFCFESAANNEYKYLQYASSQDYWLQKNSLNRAYVKLPLLAIAFIFYVCQER